MTDLAPADVGISIALIVDVLTECQRADALHGDNLHLPNGTSDTAWRTALADAQTDTTRRTADGTVTWTDVLNEEVLEAFSETDNVRLRTELVQTAAVCLRWIRALDTHTPPTPGDTP